MYAADLSREARQARVQLKMATKKRVHSLDRRRGKVTTFLDNYVLSLSVFTTAVASARQFFQCDHPSGRKPEPGPCRWEYARDMGGATKRLLGEHHAGGRWRRHV